MESLTLTEEACSIETMVVMTDGEGDLSINGDVPVDFFNVMANIFYKFGIFDAFLDNVYDEDTGL